MTYAVQTPVFEGPFDLLLHLILDQQVDIFEVRLLEVVDAYVAELERMRDLELEVATEFLLIASTLVELKARRLLPQEADPDLDDDLSLWEERDLILSKLLECKTFKDAARSLDALFDVAARSVPRALGPGEEFAGLLPDVMGGVTPEKLRDAYFAAIAPKPVPQVTLDHVTSVPIRVEDAIIELADEVRRAGRITFRELTRGLGTRIEVIVRFLALLELFKQGVIEVEQLGGNFGAIVVEWAAETDVSVAELVTADAYEG